jgi:mannose/cellobiose epimerase-like protein (N-acyl-D-glucosamine 2-epimerase family)
MPLAAPDCPDSWRNDPVHRAFLLNDADAQFSFFAKSLRPDGGFDAQAHDGSALAREGQPLHGTTRMVHAFALAKALGRQDADDMIDAGMTYLAKHHRDPGNGGYFWAVDGATITDSTKLAYGHVFVLLAASSARLAGHPNAPALLDDAAEVIETRFWNEAEGRLADEFTADWQPFSGYRGMNANMHGVEAMLAAFEATGDSLWLYRAGRILEFFTDEMPAAWDWRIPEHYQTDWTVDHGYKTDNPIFRPEGTTPGHSLEWARLLLQHWDLSDRPDNGAEARARKLIYRALEDAWLPQGGLAYTLGMKGEIDIATRFWWPVTEAIGAVSALLKIGGSDQDEEWYRRLWTFSDTHLIDHARGGWFPELDDAGQPAETQFTGKPDIYHALQAGLYALTPGLSRHQEALSAL